MDADLKKNLIRLLWILSATLVILSIYIGFNTFNLLSKNTIYSTLAVDASAEVFAVPDIAEVYFSIKSENKEIAPAQLNVEEKINNIIDSLKNIGILEKDIKTNFYNANPRYDYKNSSCEGFRCPEGERTLIGYEVLQSVVVTIRDISKTGEVLSVLGQLKVSDLYGPNFRIENEEELKAKVREDAIQKAREKGKSLAKNLGVKIVGIENFSEGFGGFYFAKSEAVRQEGDLMTPISTTVTLPAGENKITTTVNIIYKVK